MSEERLNPFFDFNAKIEATIKDAKNIIEKHKEDNSCEPPDFVCLAYDTINCLNQLQQENEELQQENKELKQRFYNAIHEMQLIQMDGEVSVRDITKLVSILKGYNV